MLALSVPTADPFAAKTLMIGFALGCMAGAWVGGNMAWFSARWARVAWGELRRWNRMRLRRRDRRMQWR